MATPSAQTDTPMKENEAAATKSPETPATPSSSSM